MKLDLFGLRRAGVEADIAVSPNPHRRISLASAGVEGPEPAARRLCDSCQCDGSRCIA